MSPCGVPCPPLATGAIGYLGGRGAAFKNITLRSKEKYARLCVECGYCVGISVRVYTVYTGAMPIAMLVQC